MSPKRVEAWAFVSPAGDEVELRHYNPRGEDYYGFKIVRLVPHSPTEQAIVRAAVKHYKAHGSRTHSNDCDVCAAAERHLRKGKR